MTNEEIVNIWLITEGVIGCGGAAGIVLACLLSTAATVFIIYAAIIITLAAMLIPCLVLVVVAFFNKPTGADANTGKGEDAYSTTETTPNPLTFQDTETAVDSLLDNDENTEEDMDEIEKLEASNNV